MGVRREKAAEVAERRARALELRAQRYTYEQIADILGLGSRQEAHKDVERALQQRREKMHEAADTLVAVESIALDRDEHDLTRIRNGLVNFIEGRPVDENDEPIEMDDALDSLLKIVDRLLKIRDRRAKLHGLDAPTRVEQTGTLVNYLIEGMDPTDLLTGGDTTPKGPTP